MANDSPIATWTDWTDFGYDSPIATRIAQLKKLRSLGVFNVHLPGWRVGLAQGYEDWYMSFLGRLIASKTDYSVGDRPWLVDLSLTLPDDWLSIQ